jgi:hypothetical protein
MACPASPNPLALRPCGLADPLPTHPWPDPTYPLHTTHTTPHARTHTTVYWESIERLLHPLLAKLKVTPTLITLHSGYWNIAHQPDQVKSAPLHHRAQVYEERWEVYTLPLVRRLFPTSRLAFRNVPYARLHQHLGLSRLVSLMNTILTRESQRWGIPVVDHNLVVRGMYHLYQEDRSHHTTPLIHAYLDAVLYELVHG